MSDPFEVEDYGGWFSPLFPSHGYGWIVLVSFLVSGTVFALGYAIAAVGGLTYPAANVYLGTFVVFAMLAALGIADGTYVDVWNDVRDAFDVDDETYAAVVDDGLARIHDDRRILAIAALLALPYFYVVTVSYLQLPWPLSDLAVEYFFGGTLNFAPGLPSAALICLFGAVSALLVATILNGFLSHLVLVGEVADLPFRNVHTAASELEPLAGYTVASATAWFAAVSLIVLWMQTSLGQLVGTTMIAVLAVAGLVFFAAPQLILHDALADAKRAEIAAIREEYAELHRLVAAEEDPPEDLSLRLEVTDRRLENAQAISTWVYDLTSVGKLVAAAVIPWLTIVQDIQGILP